MKNNNISSIFITIILLVAVSAATKEIERYTSAKNLVVVVINGVRYEDAFGDKHHLYIDNIWNKFKPYGSICTKFENKELTFPIPAQMSLLTGIWHILEDPLNDSIAPAFPTLFEYWNHAYKDQGNTCYFASNDQAFTHVSSSMFEGFGDMYAPVIDIETESDKNNAVYDKVMPYILKNHPSFIYVSLGTGIGGKGSISEVLGKEDDCDPRTKDACASDLLNIYYESIIFMDAIVYDLWDRIHKEKEYKDNTIFLVLSSHGRHTNEFHSFGDKCRGCTHLFMLAMGPGIKKGYVSNRKRSLIDVCKTVGALFALPTPFAKGSIMKELFE